MKNAVEEIWHLWISKFSSTNFEQNQIETFMNGKGERYFDIFEFSNFPQRNLIYTEIEIFRTIAFWDFTRWQPPVSKKNAVEKIWHLWISKFSSTNSEQNQIEIFMNGKGARYTDLLDFSNFPQRISMWNETEIVQNFAFWELTRLKLVHAS